MIETSSVEWAAWRRGQQAIKDLSSTLALKPTLDLPEKGWRAFRAQKKKKGKSIYER